MNHQKKTITMKRILLATSILGLWLGSGSAPALAATPTG
jgi:hypothetical protein